VTDPEQSGAPPVASGKKKGGLQSRWPNIVGWVISAAALAYVLSRVQLSELRKDLSGMTWWLVVAAIVLEIVPRLLEAVRWRSLLQPICTRFTGLLQAIYIGTVYSSILPLSGGDVVRGVIVARTAAANVTQVLSTEIVERVVDAVAIILVVWFALRGLALPQALRVVRILLEVGVAAAIAGGLVVIIRRVDLVSRLSRWTTANPLLRRVRSVGLDLVQAIGWVRPRAMMVAMAAALGAAIVNVAAYWLMLRAYHIDLSLIQAAGLFAIVMIGTFLPGTPGNVGSWQFFCTIGLQLFGVTAAKAAGFSIVAYFIWTIPPLLIGLVALVLSPFSWSELRTGRPEPSIQVGGVCETDRPGKKSGTGGDAP
jgi:glycosyltransferase 2 family protein